jgi:hypothetical protein
MVKKVKIATKRGNTLIVYFAFIYNPKISLLVYTKGLSSKSANIFSVLLGLCLDFPVKANPAFKNRLI